MYHKKVKEQKKLCDKKSEWKRWKQIKYKEEKSKVSERVSKWVSEKDKVAWIICRRSWEGRVGLELHAAVSMAKSMRGENKSNNCLTNKHWQCAKEQTSQVDLNLMTSSLTESNKWLYNNYYNIASFHAHIAQVACWSSMLRNKWD